MCSACMAPLLTRPFYHFSCGHAFHSDCLVEALLPHLGEARACKLTELQAQVAALGREGSGDKGSSGTGVGRALPSKQDMVQAELDDLVAGECPYCGEIMIKSVDKPFIDGKEFDDLIQEWL